MELGSRQWLIFVCISWVWLMMHTDLLVLRVVASRVRSRYQRSQWVEKTAMKCEAAAVLVVPWSCRTHILIRDPLQLEVRCSHARPQCCNYICDLSTTKVSSNKLNVHNPCHQHHQPHCAAKIK